MYIDALWLVIGVVIIFGVGARAGVKQGRVEGAQAGYELGKRDGYEAGLEEKK